MAPHSAVWWLKTRIGDLGEKSKAPSQSPFPGRYTHTPSIRGRWVTCISRFADPLWEPFSIHFHSFSTYPRRVPSPHSFLFPLRDRQIVGRVILFLLPFTYRLFPLFTGHSSLEYPFYPFFQYNSFLIQTTARPPLSLLPPYTLDQKERSTLYTRPSPSQDEFMYNNRTPRVSN